MGADVDVVISCAFGSPYEGDIEPSAVAALADRCRIAGARVTLADTTGMATPRRVADVVEVCGSDVGLHFHDTRGTALVNAFAAMQLGVVRFDTSVGGLGGSPFAVGAQGNLATEDLDGTFEQLQGSVAEVVQEPIEQPYGVRDCAFRDPAGNLIRIIELR